jgi:hypothetical protein
LLIYNGLRLFSAPFSAKTSRFVIDLAWGFRKLSSLIAGTHEAFWQ